MTKDEEFESVAPPHWLDLANKLWLLTWRVIGDKDAKDDRRETDGDRGRAE